MPSTAVSVCAEAEQHSRDTNSNNDAGEREGRAVHWLSDTGERRSRSIRRKEREKVEERAPTVKVSVFLGFCFWTNSKWERESHLWFKEFFSSKILSSSKCLPYPQTLPCRPPPSPYRPQSPTLFLAQLETFQSRILMNPCRPLPGTSEVRDTKPIWGIRAT